MAKVQLCNITVMDNPSPFLNPFQFEITFECIEELKEGMYYGCYYRRLNIALSTCVRFTLKSRVQIYIIYS